MKTIGLIFCLSLSISSAFAFAPPEPWGHSSSPSVMGDLEYRYTKLPLAGSAGIKNKFWSGDYWPNQLGNINKRWFAGQENGFSSYSPSREQARVMSAYEIAKLSPAEKFDLFNGRYHYPLRNEVASEYADRSADEWEGICHGWAAASMNHTEPHAKNMTNPDGIVIPFGSSDIKALISYYYANVFKYDSHMMGDRCDKKGFWGQFSRDCKQDLNAGAFHLALANKIGVKKEGLIADVDRYKEVWNHPIKSYKTTHRGYKKRSGDSAPGTALVALVETSIVYIDEQETNDWKTVLGTEAQMEKTKTFKYELDLNANYQIIGGKFDGKERPDFVWTVEKAVIWIGGFERLKELLND